VRVWICRCGEKQAEEPPQDSGTKPAILYFDIERAPGLAYYYDRKVQGGYISTHMLKEEPFIICFAAAWYNDADEFQKVESYCMTTDEAGAKSDRRILKELWGMMNRADWIVGHNVDGFDIKKVNNRFLQLGMNLPYMYRTVDTLKLSRKYFPFESNGLDYIAVRLGGRPKIDIHFDDWKRIVETGDNATLDKAEMYCRGDVREGMGVFKHMRRVIESSGRKVIK